MKVLMRRLIPQTLGGDEYNIWVEIVERVMGIRRGCHLNADVQLQEYRKPLWDFIKRHKCKTILEIGLGNGKNTEKMIELAGNDCEYYCFDNLSRLDSQKAFWKLKDRKNVHFYIGDSRETLPKVVDGLPKMDLIFIDGGQEYDVIKNDWWNCKRLMNPWTVCFFRYYPLSMGVRRVVGKIDDGFSVKIIKPKLGPWFALVRQRSIPSNNRASAFYNQDAQIQAIA